MFAECVDIERFVNVLACTQKKQHTKVYFSFKYGSAILNGKLWAIKSFVAKSKLGNGERDATVISSGNFDVRNHLFRDVGFKEVKSK